jgi:hypothetical protein
MDRSISFFAAWQGRLVAFWPIGMVFISTAGAIGISGEQAAKQASEIHEVRSSEWR